MDYADKELLEMICSGNDRQLDTAMRQLYRDCYKMAESHILRNSGNNEDAADVFQEALIVLLSKVRQPNFMLTSKVSTFLFGISKNLWSNKRRKVSRETVLNEAINPGMETTEKQIYQNECLEMVEGYLNQMSNDCRGVLVDYYFNKMRMVKIAEKMGFSSEQVAKNKKSNCMKKLKTLVAGNPNLGECIGVFS